MDVGEPRGIKGFIHKVTGQTARENQAKAAAEAARQAQFRQEEFRRKELLGFQKNASLYKKELSEATMIDRVMHVEPTEEEAERIGKEVKAWSLTGKFEKGLTIDGKLLTKESSVGFQDLGDTKAVPKKFGSSFTPYLSPVDLVGSLTHNAHRFSSDDIGFKHWFITVNKPGTQDCIVSFLFKGDQKAIDSRPGSIFSISLLLDKKQGYTLQEILKKNPDLAQTFLSEAVPGWEYSPESKSGIKRVKSDELIIVNADKFPLDIFNPFIKDGHVINDGIYSVAGNFSNRILPEFRAQILKNDNGQVDRVKYSHPFGVASPEASI